MAGDVRRQVLRTAPKTEIDRTAELAIPNSEYVARKLGHEPSIAEADHAVLPQQVLKKFDRVGPQCGKLFGADISRCIR
jgi:hypothetical protein